jgi:deferrochelatase/peroxidase EfeB
MLDNEAPVDFRSPRYAPLFERLQGNVLKSHGRDFTLNVFLQCHRRGDALRTLLAELASRHVTSARDQLLASEAYRRTGIEGPTFGNLFLTRGAYAKLGIRPLDAWFPDVHFQSGMFASSRDLGDRLTAAQAVEPLERAYVRGAIDAMVLLADNDERALSRAGHELIDALEREGAATVLAVEVGRMQRNDRGVPIEHFGYADGRSQPLFLASDFVDLAPDGGVDVTRTAERVGRACERIDCWNPFASLSLALRPDPGVDDPWAFGSYYVFRKLEQNVRAFVAAEAELADRLQLTGADRDRAGAMIVGRFRDGTPLVLDRGPGGDRLPPNNFRYDGLNASCLPDPAAPIDRLGLKCPFQAHVRKMNPRQSVDHLQDAPDVILSRDLEARSRRIVRRGITYGMHRPGGNGETGDARPVGGIGLLFACFQGSIVEQFAFVQREWANSIRFPVDGGASTPTGTDPLVGQRHGQEPVPHNWRTRYGGPMNEDRPEPEPDQLMRFSHAVSHRTRCQLPEFVRFRGGEYFFAPSLPFLLGR